MQKFITPIISLLTILIVLLNIDTITDKIINILNHPNVNKIENFNKYYKDANYEYVANTQNFVPYGKQDLLNIIYTTINSGTSNFVFYCPKEYTNCIDDVNNFSTDANLLTHLNNFVHPFNSFTTIDTTIIDSGEINFNIKYLYTEDEIKQIDEEVDLLLEKLLTDDITEDYDKIKVIHDYIINQTKYEDPSKSSELKSYSAYGALFNHVASCNGYTDLMAIFLTKMGYDNFKVATTKEVDGVTKGHVWNAVNVGGEWLHLDLTWDDPVSSDGKNYLYHKYFLINTEELIIADSNITSDEHEFKRDIYPELKSISN